MILVREEEGGGGIQCQQVRITREQIRGKFRVSQGLVANKRSSPKLTVHINQYRRVIKQFEVFLMTHYQLSKPFTVQFYFKTKTLTFYRQLSHTAIPLQSDCSS